MTDKRKRFLIDLLVGLAIAVAVIALNSQQTDNWIQRLCDGCFVSAVMLLGFGGLVSARNHGVFDIITYSVTAVFHTHVPGASIGRAREEREDFVDYKQRKEKERRPAKEALWAGLVYLALSLVLLAVYYLVS